MLGDLPKMTEDEMVGWHHWLDGHEFEQTPGVGDGQGGLRGIAKSRAQLGDWNEQLISVGTWIWIQVKFLIHSTRFDPVTILCPETNIAYLKCKFYSATTPFYTQTLLILSLQLE